MGTAWDALNEQYKKQEEEQTLPSQRVAPAKTWAELNASFAKPTPAPSRQSVIEAQIAEAPKRSIMFGGGTQPFLSSAKISAPAQKTTSVQGISFNSPSSGLPIIGVNNPRIETTEGSSTLSKIAGAGINAIAGVFTNTTYTLGNLFESLDSRNKPIDRVAAMIDMTASVASIPFAKVSAELSAAEELPIVGTPIFGNVNKVFHAMDSISRFGGAKLVENLPVTDETKEILSGPVQNLAGIVGTLGLVKGIHIASQTGGGRVVDALPVSQGTKAKIKGTTSLTASVAMAPFTTAYKTIVGTISTRVKTRTDMGQEVTPNDAKAIVNKTVKEVPIPEDTGAMRIPTSEGDVILRTDQKTVLQNLIRGREDIEYKVVDTLGKDLDGNAITSRFEWDFKKKQAVIYSTNKTTATSLAHELGHYVDRKLGITLNSRLSDVLPNYRENRDQVNQMLADYALDRLGGNATKPEIDAEILRVVDSLNQEIKVVAANESRQSSNEQFASAFAGVIDNPKMRDLAPELSQLVDFSGAREAKRPGTSEVQGKPGSVEEKGSTLTALEKARRGTVSDTVKNDANFQEKLALEQTKAESIAMREERASQNYEWKGVLRALKNSTEYKKEGSVTDATIDGTIMTRNGRDILVPREKVKEFAGKGYTVKATMDEIATANGFESAEQYTKYITELSSDYREIDRSSVQKKAHDYLLEKDPNYAKLTETIDSLREELVREEAVVRATEPRSGKQEGQVVSETRQERGEAIAEPQGNGKIAGTGLDTGQRVKDRLSYNKEKINAPEDVENLITSLSSASKEFTSQRISKSDADIQELAFEVGVKAEDLMKVQAGSIANAETVFASRKIIADMAADLRDTIRSKTKDGATEADLAEVKTKLLRLQGVMKTVAGFRTEASNVFRQFKLEARAGENDILKDLIGELKKVDEKSGDDLSKFVKGTREAMQPTLLDKGWHLWYMSILSGPNTQLKNFFGNAGNMAAELARVAVTSPSELPTAFQGLTAGFRKGFESGMEILKNGDTSKFEARGIEPIKFEGKASFLNYMDYVGRFMSATDAVFKEGFRGMEIRSLSREQAMKEGYKGAELVRRTEELTAEPLEEVLKQANAFAERGTYTQKPIGIMGMVSEAISSVTTPRRSDTTLKTFARSTGRLIVPFTRIVANVVNVGLDWTPVGALRTVDVMKEGGTLRQRNQAMSRAVLGTIAMAGFASLAAEGNLSGHGPTDKKRREQLSATGWRANSVKIGDKWYPYTSWGPFAIPMALVGNLFDGYEYEDMKEEGWQAQSAYAVAGSINSILDISFLQNVSDLFSWIRDPAMNKTYLENFLAQQATSPIPNFFKQIARWQDPGQYEAKGVWERIKYNLRITSGLKPALNVWGEQKVGEALTGIQPSNITDDETLKYLVDNELFISIPSKATVLDLGRDKRPMTEDEYYEYVKQSGPEIKRRISQRLEYIKRLPDDEERQKYIESIVEDVRTDVKNDLVREAKR